MKETFLRVDPSYLYDMKVEDNLARMRRSSEVLPRLVSEYLPKSLFRNVNLYIDPFAKWNIGSFTVSPAKRKRWRKINSVLGSRSYYIGLTRTGSTGLYPQVGTPDFTSSSTSYTNTYTLQAMPDGYAYSYDTTARTRGYNQPFGEFERFSLRSFSSPARSHLTVTSVNSFSQGFGGQNYSIGTDYRRWGVNGSSAYFTQADIDGLQNSAISAIKAELVKSGPRALMGCLPAYRPYTFGRSLIELRDLPRSLYTLNQSLGSLRDIYHSLGSVRDVVFNVAQGSKQVPKEYLGYHFAWKQMYEDIVKLVSSPERIARRINYLMRNAGKDAVLRHTLKYNLESLTTPGLRYDQIVEYEGNRVVSTTHERAIEIRAMCSLYFDFPPVALPVLRTSKFSDLLGFQLRPTDVYKVIPWTWLYDWFTNLGTYIDLIDTVNRDRTTINYGFVTGVLTGKITTTYRFTHLAQRHDYIYAGPTPDWQTSSTTSVNHTSVLTYEAAVRLYASSLSAPALHVIASKSNLTTWQQSILGALLASRVKR